MISVAEAKKFYEGADSAHDWDHILRVVASAEKLARAEGGDIEVVRVAALLHDIARAEEDHGNESVDHADVSAEKARQLLLSKNASEAFADQVAGAIRSHRFRGSRQPETLEARILFDADKLDAIGAIGVARAYAVAGSLNQKLYSEADDSGCATRTQHDSNHTPVKEFTVKLAKLRDRFHTPTAKTMAEVRHAFMVEFFRELEREVKEGM